MAGTYLSKRKRNDHSLNFYAVTNIWNPEKKRQDKKQVFIGTFLNGHCRFNEKAIEYADLFKSTYSLNSSPEPNVPDAVVTGFFILTPAKSTERFISFLHSVQ